MKSDPIYLFQVLPQKASLGVLSVAGNVCRMILSESLGYVKMLVAFDFECLGDFTSLCEEEEERFGSIDEVLMVVEDKRGRES